MWVFETFKEQSVMVALFLFSLDIYRNNYYFLK